MNFSLECLNSFWERNIVIRLVIGCVLAAKLLCELCYQTSFDKDLHDISAQ